MGVEQAWFTCTLTICYTFSLAKSQILADNIFPSGQAFFFAA